MEMGNGIMEGRQWCNICCNMVIPMNEGEINKCPLCGTEFTESIGIGNNLRDNNEGTDLRSASVFCVYAPILMGLMSALSPALATSASTSNSSINDDNGSREESEEAEPDTRHHELVVSRRRRRTSTSLMLIFRRLHHRMVSEMIESHHTNPETNRNSIDHSNNSNNNMNLSVIVIDPFTDQALILRGPSHMNHARPSALSENPVGSLGEFLDGPGFGLLLQHMAQNDPNNNNRYVSNVNPPAQRAAIEALPTVTTEENMLCIICLEDTEIGSEVKKMPCEHKFHNDCIVPWLKLHSSCPVCRFQMPFDESKVETTSFERPNEGDRQNNERVVAREERMRIGRRNWLSILQPFDYFLPSP